MIRIVIFLMKPRKLSSLFNTRIANIVNCIYIHKNIGANSSLCSVSNFVLSSVAAMRSLIRMHGGDLRSPTIWRL